MCLNFFIKHKITNLLELLFYCKEKFKQLHRIEIKDISFFDEVSLKKDKFYLKN